MAEPTTITSSSSNNPSSNPATATEDQQKKEALAAFTATLHSVGTNLEAPLRDRAATITSNSVALQRQENELAENTARLAKQNAQWAGLADETRDGLKEIGDVQNWAEMIERDLLVLEDMMDDVERKDLERDDDMNGIHSDGDDHGHGGIHEVEGNGHGMNGVSNGDPANGNLKNQKKTEPRKGWFGWW